jgi:tetrahedral aminopeptidase
LDEKTASGILLELSSSAGVSGNESAAVETAAGYFRSYTDQVKYDRFGNLLAFKPGEPSSGRGKLSLAIVAHIDEIGLMVTKIEAGGFLRFTPIGGIDPRTLPGQAVQVGSKNKLSGVIGAAPPHLLSDKDRKAVIPIEKLFIDLGLTEKTVKEQVSVGDFVSFEQEPLVIGNGAKVTGKSLDNRAGVTAMIISAAELAGISHQADICFIASLQEEVGLRGAITNAYGLQPDLALIVDVTHGDAPGLDHKSVYKLGSGPALAIGPNFHPALSRQLQDTAKQHYLPYQTEPIPGHSGTDAWAFQVSREGIPCALLSIPLRYMHTTVEMISLKDLMVSGKLISYFARFINRSFLEELRQC